MGDDPRRHIYALQAEICRGLGHPVRLEIVHLLGAGELPFGELTARMQVSKAKLSQHLAVLRKAGIVLARREGARTLYRLRHPEIEAACQAVAQVLARHLAEMRASTDALLRTVAMAR